jgi:hypothetical protein
MNTWLSVRFASPLEGRQDRGSVCKLPPHNTTRLSPLRVLRLFSNPFVKTDIEVQRGRGGLIYCEGNVAWLYAVYMLVTTTHEDVPRNVQQSLQRQFGCRIYTEWLRQAPPPFLHLIYIIHRPFLSLARLAGSCRIVAPTRDTYKCSLFFR